MLRLTFAFFWLAQSLRSSVNEVIQAIDTQLAKQDDIQKKKVWFWFIIY